MAGVISDEKKIQNEKDGGPYTKDERTKRQNEVARLHFQYGYPAVKIAEMMRVNRNTINSDIKYLYSNIKKELGQSTENFVLKQIARLEAQRTRIVEQIEKGKTGNTIKEEKLLLDVDSKINSFLIKVNANQENEESDLDIQGKKIKEFVLYILVKYNRYGNRHGLSREKIASEMINVWRCSAEKAETTLSQLNNMGLKYCEKHHDGSFMYDFLEFAFMQRYVCPEDSFSEGLQELSAIQSRFDTESGEIAFAYDKKYRDGEKWSEQILDGQEQEYEEINKKHTKEISTITTKLLESFSDQKSYETFVKFIDVFFAEKSLQVVKTAYTQ